MDDDEPSLQNIANEFLTPGYRERAAIRRKASKTVWDLLFMPIGFGLVGLFWYGFTQFFLWLHLVFFPADAARMPGLMGGSITLGQALIFLVPAFAALPLGFIVSNRLQWLVPPARRAAEKKSQGVKWADYYSAQKGLFSMARVMVPFGLLCGFVGVFLLGR